MHSAEPPSRIRTGSTFRDSWRNVLHITSVRVIAQAVFLGLFLTFVVLTTFVSLDRRPDLRHWLSKFLETDPLVSITSALTTHTLYRGLAWSLVILIPTFFLGRFFCNWICPLGTLNQLVGWLFRTHQSTEAIEANRYRHSQQLKYLILIGMAALALFGSLQIGWLDPIALTHRSFTTVIVPALEMPAGDLAGGRRFYRGAGLIGIIALVMLAMNARWPRFFCRVLCPLGALLGVLGRFSWWRIERDPVKCHGCDRCRQNCEGACDPQGDLRTAECLVCFNCIEDCPEGALSFKLFPSRRHELPGPDLSRRKAIFAAASGVVLFPLLRSTGRSSRDFSSNAIRPPGALEERAFLERCIKCDQCMRVCPTNVLQPAWFETGIEGLWTPVLNFRMGHCQLHCTACGVVCPTGAIQRVSLERKLGLGPHADQGPIRLGTAHFDIGRCLPHSMDVPCAVCEEVCPTSPKAIYREWVLRPVRNGRFLVLAATEDTVTVGRWLAGEGQADTSVHLSPDQWRGNGELAYHVIVQHADGMTERQRILGNDEHTLTIKRRFARPPAVDDEVVVHVEIAVPRIDLDLCIGCGICEKQCPVVGDRRAVYVTAEGETRSQDHPDRDRNRAVRA